MESSWKLRTAFKTLATSSARVRRKGAIRRPYRGTSLIRNSAPLGTFSRNMPRALWWPLGGGLFLMSEVPL